MTTSLLINFIENFPLENSYSQDLSSDSRIDRSFESLITERNGNQEELDSSLYSHVFSQIKNKLFSLTDFKKVESLSPEQIDFFEKKYYTSDLANSINRVKKLLVNNFNKKIELEIKIENRKEQFDQFCNNIKSSLTIISSFSENDDKDNELKNLLSERIDWYYSKLEFDSLKKEYSDSLNEYSFFLKSFL